MLGRVMSVSMSFAVNDDKSSIFERSRVHASCFSVLIVLHGGDYVRDMRIRHKD